MPLDEQNFTSQANQSLDHIAPSGRLFPALASIEAIREIINDQEADATRHDSHDLCFKSPERGKGCEIAVRNVGN